MLTWWITAVWLCIGVITPWWQANRPDQWYAELVRSQLTPPNWVFGVVWPLLYAGLLWSWYRIRQLSVSQQQMRLLWPYASQLSANALWPWLFFVLHQPVVAWLCLLMTLAWQLQYSYRAYYYRQYLLVGVSLPYVLWLLFASYLNMVIVYYLFF